MFLDIFFEMGTMHSSITKDFRNLFPFQLAFAVMLRTYPPLFGLKVVKLHPRFCAKREIVTGDPLETIDPSIGVSLFSSLSWEEADMWPDARMESVFRYLRGSTDLNLGDLRPLFPTCI